MNQRGGALGLLILLIGLGVALYLYMEYSPLGKGANDSTFSKGVEAKQLAEQMKGMADERNEMYEQEMNR